MIVPEKKCDKVAILGTTSTWKVAPLEDKTWEVWGMNAFWNTWGKYATRWFEIHQLPILYYDDWKEYSWLKTCPLPVYMAKHYPIIPNSIPYPVNEVSKGGLKIFSSTFCYQLALAIHEGYKTIGLFGVDFTTGSLRERFIEKQGVLYWLGVAMGKGITIQFPKKGESKFTHRYLYGIEYWNEVKDVRAQIKRPVNTCLDYGVDGVTSMILNHEKRTGKK